MTENREFDAEYLSNEEYDEIVAGEERKKKIRKRIIYVLSVVIASVLLALYISPKMINRINQSLIMQTVVSEPNAENRDDGVYKGTYSSAGYSCTVEVTVVEHVMTKIEITDSVGIDRKRAEAVCSGIVAFQSFDLYELSYGGTSIGTHPTDIVLYLAVDNALIKGEQV